MQTGAKMALGGSLILILAVGVRVGLIYRERHSGDTPPPKAEYKADPDDLVFLKSEHPMSLQDERDLKGRTLWVSAGGQMDYYRLNGHTADYAHSQGVLLGAQPLTVTGAIEQVAPKNATFRIPGGDRQALLTFTLPGNPTPYAVPVGYREAGSYTFLTDQIFFYQDPHQLYSHWGPAIWQAIDEHRAIPGMNERQVQMALGQISENHGDTTGDRSVTYDNQGHPKLVTYRDKKAVTITDQKP